MWYCRFGEDSISLDDQRRLQSRDRQEHALRKAVISARREMLFLQRAAGKDKRFERFLKKKERCLDVKLRNPGSILKPKSRLLSPERKAEIQYKKDVARSIASPYSTASPEGQDALKGVLGGQKQLPSSSRTPRDNKENLGVASKALASQIKPPPLTKPRSDSFSSRATPPLSPTKSASPSKTSARKALHSRDKSPPRGREIGGAAGAGKSFVERVALELRSVRSPSKRGRLDEAATEKLLQELRKKVTETAVKMDKINMALPSGGTSSLALGDMYSYGGKNATSRTTDPLASASLDIIKNADDIIAREKKREEDKMVMQSFLALPPEPSGGPSGSYAMPSPRGPDRF
ncbi:unnamed protein product [Amoebophrya sp. A25]|nr:unnamed protein product [Amoebophrya sp. A25]|eukprot:GSA25T00006796001.1